MTGDEATAKPSKGWNVTFAENQSPGGTIDYSMNMLIAPEITLARDTTIGKPGGAQVSMVKLLVRRGAEESAIYGFTDNGETRGLSKDEFEAELTKRGSTNFAPPPQWPSPVTAD